ncbi:hypothetical protein DB32_001997 [Sandaracinus amylolyticus]|uniref:Peptidoglycan binding-like domain-containing protein n=1 Tax=Sandaracinus amylolyticus TaxID=927083 RepID=A0A0F6W197_9BACT|nr:hypothetical protein DB32_001997 [Sandaracinus amylolyticus]
MHVVRQGEDVPSIAARYGVADPARIWNAPENEALRARRRSMHVLLPGDRVSVPPPREKRVDCATGQRHRFEVRTGTVELHLRLRLPDGTTLGSEPYVLVFHDRGVEQTRDGTTTGDGELREVLPARIRAAMIELPRRRLRWELAVGTLDPHADEDTSTPVLTGIQARLNNLGFMCGRVDGELGPKTRHALSEFQREVLGRTEPTGDLDQETWDRLMEEHGT